jgi:hypothetical protein
MSILSNVGPYLGVVGNELANLDENTSGADDFAGQLLLYAADVIAVIDEGVDDLPPFPDALKVNVSDKITGPGKMALRIASSVLMLAQFQVTGKGALALRYIAQAVRNLLSGTLPPVPPRPILG